MRARGGKFREMRFAPVRHQRRRRYRSFAIASVEMGHVMAIMVILVVVGGGDKFGVGNLGIGVCEGSGDVHPKSELLVNGTGLRALRAESLRSHAQHMEHLSLIDVPELESIELGCFSNLTKLTSLYIWRAPLLKLLPRKSLIPPPPQLRSLRITNSGIEELPDLILASSKHIMHIIDFEGNKLKRLHSYGIKVRVDQLILDNNEIEEIEEFAFDGSEMAELSLKGNMLLKIVHDASFGGLLGIRKLDISSTSIVHFPSKGLSTMEVLWAQNIISMKTIPSIHYFKELKQARLTHHFHCCAFRFPELHDPERHEQYLAYSAHMKQLCSDTENDSAGRSMSKRSVRKVTNNASKIGRDDYSEDYSFIISGLSGGKLETLDEGYIEESELDDFEETDDLEGMFSTFHSTPISANASMSIRIICDNVTDSSAEHWREILCTPEPDALNPCEDVLGGRAASAIGWGAGAAAFVGNVVVAGVLLTRRPLVAPRLLLLQLALADLGTAAYLLLVAAVDAYARDEYFNHAYDWQYGLGCQMAGFLAVWGAQASLLALAALTLERWLAITQALLPQRRLQMRGARALTLASVIYSALLAAGPLFGASDYSSTSICLPMRRDNWLDTIYLGSLLTGGLMCLGAVIGCYGHIYATLARDTPRNSAISGDARVAKKLSILIAIHMACCIPVAAVGFGALIGHPILGVHGAKLLLVLIYPLNSLADPFLYALLTHQFRRDLYLLLDRYGLCSSKAQQYKIPGVVGRHRRSGLPNSNNVPRRPDGSLTTAYEDLLV